MIVASRMNEADVMQQLKQFLSVLPGVLQDVDQCLEGGNITGAQVLLGAIIEAVEIEVDSLP